VVVVEFALFGMMTPLSCHQFAGKYVGERRWRKLRTSFAIKFTKHEVTWLSGKLLTIKRVSYIYRLFCHTVKYKWTSLRQILPRFCFEIPCDKDITQFIHGRLGTYCLMQKTSKTHYCKISNITAGIATTMQKISVTFFWGCVDYTVECKYFETIVYCTAVIRYSKSYYFCIVQEGSLPYLPYWQHI